MKLKLTFTIAILAIAALSSSACSPKEIETSTKAGEVCLLGGTHMDSDGNAWSSARCASASRVDLTQGRVPNDGWGESEEDDVAIEIGDATLPAPATEPSNECHVGADGQWIEPGCAEAFRILVEAGLLEAR